MVCRSVGWWITGVLVLSASAEAAAQSSASFPDEPKKPVPAPPAPAPPAAPTPAPPAAPAPNVAPPPPLSSDSLRGPPPVAPHPIDDVRFPVRSAAPASPSAPPLLPYRDGLPVPEGYTVVDRPATGLITGGLVGLGVAYVAGVIVAASQSFENGAGLMLIPVAGPYAAIGTREYNCTVDTVDAAKRCTVRETQIVTMIAVDGLAQTAGALVALAGLVSGTKELVRNDLPDVSVTPPTSAKNGWQFSLRGDF
jgi:hypothetical protein